MLNLRSKGNPTTVDLFDIFGTLSDVSYELNDIMWCSYVYGKSDEQLLKEIGELNPKAIKLGATISDALRYKLLSQEFELSKRPKSTAAHRPPQVSK